MWRLASTHRAQRHGTEKTKTLNFSSDHSAAAPTCRFQFLYYFSSFWGQFGEQSPPTGARLMSKGWCL